MTKVRHSTTSLAESKKAEEILDVIMAFARLDFSKKIKLAQDNSVFDAIGAGVNMMGEELQHSTISLKEKEHLLKEIHHRVKNNLQIVSSLLNLQSENVLDEKYLSLIQESRNRINSMALVHEMLYSSKDLSKIELKKYIERLASSLHQSFSNPNSSIEFILKIESDIYFEIDRMIPVGLILNEIISNSLKYAFPKNKSGTIEIGLARANEKFRLTVSDNGIGLPPDFDLKKDSSLGMQLIHILCDQIDGEVSLHRENGTHYEILF
jgi:two-component sensor histidine kinase